MKIRRCFPSGGARAGLAAKAVVGAIGAICLLSFVAAANVWNVGQPPTSRASAAVPERGLLAFTARVDDQQQQLVVIDPATKVVAVYNINLTSGAIELRGVRNITWDLQMVHFNGQPPLPQELRALIESGR